MALLVVYAAAAWLFLAGVLVQVFLAGMGLFKLSDWSAHTGLGWGLGSAPILLVLLALIAQVGRRTILLTAGLMIAAMVQPELAAARHETPIVAALHPVNALLVFWLAWVVAGRATEALREASRRRPTDGASEPGSASPPAVAAAQTASPSPASRDQR